MVKNKMSRFLMVHCVQLNVLPVTPN